MPYKYDETGLEDQIEDHIHQLMERFNHSKDKILELVKMVLDNHEEGV